MLFGVQQVGDLYQYAMFASCDPPRAGGFVFFFNGFLL